MVDAGIRERFLAVALVRDELEPAPGPIREVVVGRMVRMQLPTPLARCVNGGPFWTFDPSHLDTLYAGWTLP